MKRCDSWDPSQQIQGLKCPSQPNPNKNNIETCSVKLPFCNLTKCFLACQIHSEVLKHVLQWEGSVI